MATRRGRRANKTSYITYEELEALGFGSWLKKNAGMVGAVVGGAIGTVIAPGMGTAIGAQLGSTLGGAVSANEADKEQTALRNKMVQQQNARSAAEAQLRMEMNSTPNITTIPVLAYGGSSDNLPDKKSSNKTSSSITSSPSTSSSNMEGGDSKIVGYKILDDKGETEILPEELNDLNTFLDMKNHVDKVFFSHYAKKNKKMDEIMAREGLTYDEAAAKYKNEAPPSIDLKLAFNSYPKVLKKELTVEEAVELFQKFRDRFTPNASSLLGTLEPRNVVLPSQVGYGRRNASTKYQIVPVYSTETTPIIEPSKERDSLNPSMPNDSLNSSVPNDSLNPSIPNNGLNPSVPNDNLSPSVPNNGLNSSVPNNSLNPPVSKDNKNVPISEDSSKPLNWKNLSYDRVSGVPHVYKVYAPGRRFLGFVNQVGHFIPYDPKLGDNITNYKNATEGWQYAGNDIITKNGFMQSMDSWAPYFVSRNNGRIMIVDPDPKGFFNPLVVNRAYYAKGGLVSPGTINYTGQTHEGPDGGIPIDDNGNPVAKNGMNPIAMVEKGEVAYSSPDIGTYIFSNRLKYKDGKTFADKAKDIQKKYKLRMKDGKINDPISEVGYRKEMEALIEQQEAFREVSGVNREEAIKQQFAEIGLPIKNNILPIGANGIHIKPSRRGTFTAAAKKHGMGVQEFARHVLANKEKYSGDMVKKANFAYNSFRWNTKGGGSFAEGAPIQSTVGVGTVAIPALASTLGNIWLMNKMKKRDKDSSKLNYTPIGYQEVDLSNERNAATENALATQANLRRNALLTGASAGQTLENNIQSVLGVQRELGKQLSDSYRVEASENAKIRSETDKFNAMNAMEANKFNIEKEMENSTKYDNIRAAIANSWAKAASDYLAGVREAKALNMRSENYSLQYSGDKWWKNFLFANSKIGAKKS